MFILYREIAEGLNMRDSNFWFGLQKLNGVWTYLNKTIPSDEDIHWCTYLSKSSTDNEVAMCFLSEGHPCDLLTFAYPRSLSYSTISSLCEYNCD